MPLAPLSKWTDNTTDTGFVGSIGGTLGLFIGFSFRDIIDMVLDYLKKALTTKRNERQHHTATQNGNNGIESSIMTYLWIRLKKKIQMEFEQIVSALEFKLQPKVFVEYSWWKWKNIFN